MQVRRHELGKTCVAHCVRRIHVLVLRAYVQVRDQLRDIALGVGYLQRPREERTDVEMEAQTRENNLFQSCLGNG